MRDLRFALGILARSPILTLVSSSCSASAWALTLMCTALDAVNRSTLADSLVMDFAGRLRV